MRDLRHLAHMDRAAAAAEQEAQAERNAQPTSEGADVVGAMECDEDPGVPVVATPGFVQPGPRGYILGTVRLLLSALCGIVVYEPQADGGQFAESERATENTVILKIEIKNFKIGDLDLGIRKLANNTRDMHTFVRKEHI